MENIEEYLLFDKDLLEQSKRNLEKVKTEKFNEMQDTEIVEQINFCLFVIDFILDKINKGDNLNDYFPFYIKLKRIYSLESYIRNINENTGDKEIKQLSRELYQILVELSTLCKCEFLKLDENIENKINFLFNIMEKTLKKDNKQKENINIALLLSEDYKIRIIRHYLDIKNEKEFKAFKNYEQNKIEVQKLNEEHEKNIQIINQLSKKIKNLKSDYNFVGLSQGFEKILNDKKDKKGGLLGCLILLGLLIAFPAIYKTFVGFYSVKTLHTMSNFIIVTQDPIRNNVSWQELLAILSLELILIYYFRILLRQYHLVQSEIHQLELRLTLCSFIQSYADYAKELKEKSAVTLEKFESVIFSNIMSNPEQMPSTFDGMQQLVTLIKEIRGSK